MKTLQQSFFLLYNMYGIVNLPCIGNDDEDDDDDNDDDHDDNNDDDDQSDILPHLWSPMMMMKITMTTITMMTMKMMTITMMTMMMMMMVTIIVIYWLTSNSRPLFKATYFNINNHHHHLHYHHHHHQHHHHSIWSTLLHHHYHFGMMISKYSCCYMFKSLCEQLSGCFISSYIYEMFLDLDNPRCRT